MGIRAQANEGMPAAIASPRGLCLMIAADRPVPAALRAVTGAGALLETPSQPPLGTRVTLRHAEAGTIAAEVTSHERLGIRVRFDAGEAAVGFALAAIVAEMRARA